MCVEPEINLINFIVGSTPKTTTICFSLKGQKVFVTMLNKKADMLALTILNSTYRWKEE